MEPQIDPPREESSESKRPTMRRLFLPALVAIAVLTPILTCAGLFIAARQTLPPLTDQGLAAALDQWREQGPVSYAIDLELAGARPGKVHVEVENGVVVDMQRDGRRPSQRRTWDVWSVPGLFEMLEQELQIAADPVAGMGAAPGAEIRCQAEFDPTYGFPTRYRRLVLGDGPEIAWTVTRFDARDETPSGDAKLQ
jgi:hypothetical protein